MAVEADRLVPPLSVTRAREAAVPVLPRQAARCLAYVASHPGVSGVQVRDGLGIRHDSQVSRLLARLERDGLAQGDGPRAPRAWRVTERGRSVLGGLPEGLYE